MLASRSQEGPALSQTQTQNRSVDSSLASFNRIANANPCNNKTGSANIHNASEVVSSRSEGSGSGMGQAAGDVGGVVCLSDDD